MTKKCAGWDDGWTTDITLLFLRYLHQREQEGIKKVSVYEVMFAIHGLERIPWGIDDLFIAIRGIANSDLVTAEGKDVFAIYNVDYETTSFAPLKSVMVSLAPTGRAFLEVSGVGKDNDDVSESQEDKEVVEDEGDVNEFDFLTNINANKEKEVETNEETRQPEDNSPDYAKLEALLQDLKNRFTSNDAYIRRELDKMQREYSTALQKQEERLNKFLTKKATFGFPILFTFPKLRWPFRKHYRKLSAWEYWDIAKKHAFNIEQMARELLESNKFCGWVDEEPGSLKGLARQLGLDQWELVPFLDQRELSPRLLRALVRVFDAPASFWEEVWAIHSKLYDPRKVPEKYHEVVKYEPDIIIKMLHNIDISLDIRTNCLVDGALFTSYFTFLKDNGLIDVGDQPETEWFRDPYAEPVPDKQPVIINGLTEKGKDVLLFSADSRIYRKAVEVSDGMPSAVFVDSLLVLGNRTVARRLLRATQFFGCLIHRFKKEKEQDQ